MLMLLFPVLNVAAQSSHQLRLILLDKDSSFLQHELALQTRFLSKELCVAYVEKMPAELHMKGFIAASLDSVFGTDSQTVAHLFVGEKYRLASISLTTDQKSLLLQAGLSPSLFDTAVTFSKLAMAEDRLLDLFEDSGYPFAKISLDSIAIINQTIHGNLLINKGRLYKIDSIRVRGPARISQNFIAHYLDIKKGSIYRKQPLEKINQRLLELPYLQQVQPWDLTMLNTGSLVNLYLAPKRSNQVNVLAGFLPSNQQTGGKLLLTVDANLQLENAFAGGEKIGIIWRQLQPRSPRINLQYAQPYLFNSPLGVDFAFDLYKRDSSFLNINAELGVLYMLSSNKTAKVVLQSQSTNVLDVDTISVKAFKQLPAVADVRSLNLGFDYNVVTTNYRYNPRSGNELGFYIGAGKKAIRKSNAITQIKDVSFDYTRLYDSVKLQSYQLRLKLKAAKYFPLSRQSTFKTGLQAGWFQTPDPFRNELFQVGGYRLLRGFDEESIYASSYAVGTLEYRYLLSLNSNFFTFADVGWANSTITNTSNGYIGAGIGLSFETKGGIFNISYAAGKRNDLNFDIRQSKIHFGYVSIF